jgi:hypothetical protein
MMNFKDDILAHLRLVKMSETHSAGSEDMQECQVDGTWNGQGWQI